MSNMKFVIYSYILILQTSMLYKESKEIVVMNRCIYVISGIFSNRIQNDFYYTYELFHYYNEEVYN